ncbi:uncharacterized protein [Ptychodera flava]|uniref:uncharacterized protein isoform X1 n=1 Tax=Ptychodera flava TaxID=63121 RepID=UPI00396A9D9D
MIPAASLLVIAVLITGYVKADCGGTSFPDGLGGCIQCAVCNAEYPPRGCEKCAAATGSEKADCVEGTFPDSLGGCVPCSYCKSANSPIGCEKCTTITRPSQAKTNCGNGTFPDGLGDCVPCAFCNSENPTIGCEMCKSTTSSVEPTSATSTHENLNPGKEAKEEKGAEGIPIGWVVFAVVVALLLFALLFVVIALFIGLYKRKSRKDPSIEDGESSHRGMLRTDDEDSRESVTVDISPDPGGGSHAQENHPSITGSSSTVGGSSDSCAGEGRDLSEGHSPVQESLLQSDDQSDQGATDLDWKVS